MKTNTSVVLAAAVLSLCACGPISPASDGGVDSGVALLTAPIRFVARVGTETFACGSSYAGIGTSNTTWQPKDLRFYVSNIRLVSHDGDVVPFGLTNDKAFQNDGVAMLDFEDATGSCSNGTAATHTELTGSVPENHYHFIRFTVGVPFDKNHQDATTADAPLNNTGMWWNWNGGYKFVRIDGKTTGLPGGHNLHLGSTGCMASATNPNVITGCTNENHFEVELAFDPDENLIVIDVKKLFDTSNLDANTANTASGCMSESTDPDCAPIFTKMGLPFGGADAGTQTVFTVE